MLVTTGVDLNQRQRSSIRVCWWLRPTLERDHDMVSYQPEPLQRVLVRPPLTSMNQQTEGNGAFTSV